MVGFFLDSNCALLVSYVLMSHERKGELICGWGKIYHAYMHACLSCLTGMAYFALLYFEVVAFVEMIAWRRLELIGGYGFDLYGRWFIYTMRLLILALTSSFPRL